MPTIQRIVSVSAIGLALLTASSCADSTTADSAEPAAAVTSSTSTPTSAAPAPTPSAATPSTETDLSDPDPFATLLTFARAWDEADWPTMETVASDEAVLAAQQWYDTEANATTGMRAALDRGCAAEDAQTAECEFLYVPAEGYALIFGATLQVVDGRPWVTSLEFEGDAG